MIRGYAFNSSADFEQVREIKEDLCYTSIDIKKERKIARETTVIDAEYTLPDGTTIYVGRERFEAPECLMNPALLEMEDEGLPRMVYDCITQCEMDCQKELFNSIFISGGTSMIPGMSSRIEKELK